MSEIDLAIEVTSDKLRGYWVKLNLISLAILFFSLIYAVIVFILEYSGVVRSIYLLKEPEIIELAAAVRNILLLISLASICAAIIIGIVLAKKTGKGSSFSLSSIDSPIASNLSLYFIYTVVVLAILDSIGIYGLTIYVLTQELHWFIIIAALSFILKFVYLPSQNRFITLMEKYQRTS
jgi:hypothetical protein